MRGDLPNGAVGVTQRYRNETCQCKKWDTVPGTNQLLLCASQFSSLNRLGFSVEICKFNYCNLLGCHVSPLQMYRQSFWQTWQRTSFYQAREGKNHAKQILRDFSDHFSPSKTPFKQNLRLNWKNISDSRCWHADFQAFQVGYWTDSEVDFTSESATIDPELLACRHTSQNEPRKKTSYLPLCWMFNRDPYKSLWGNPHISG